MPTGTVNTSADETRTVLLGGFPVGLIIKPQGVIVVGTAPVETEVGRVIVSTTLREGDIIENMNGAEINTVEDVHSALKEAKTLSATVKVRRGAALLTLETPLVLEDITGEKRLGLQIKEDVAGVGTVTYVKKDGSFGCLGHPINLANGAVVPCKTGHCYTCKILGCVKGMRGQAGELKGAFSSALPCGTLYKNCKSGVYGNSEAFKSGREIEVADRKSVSVGKAKIITTVGDTPEEYDVEIIKAVSQNSVADKSMILRVVDKRLIEKTGGIVQGMSGSPILQNGKLIGAVTHVFVSDPTKGYGIYADWMIGN
ncbi:MAG: SpoIVB peptidase [Clostridiales bacterium]|nr:SpoIVB peptidase [Clostridiales bacterium]